MSVSAGAEWDTGERCGRYACEHPAEFLGSNGSRQARPPTILTHLWRSLFLWPFTSPGAHAFPGLVAGGQASQAWARLSGWDRKWAEQSCHCRLAGPLIPAVLP